MTECLGIIAGGGVLPRLVAEDCAVRGQPYVVVHFKGVELDWLTDHPTIKASFEKPGKMFAALKKSGVSTVTMGGGMGRPRLNPLKFDATGLRLASVVMNAMKNGDNSTLKIIAALFEAEGFTVIGVHEALPALLATAGIPTQAQPSAEDKKDASRAQEIVEALGAVDVGQGAVVAQGLCLGLETLQGTDAMLRFITANPPRLPDRKGSRGLLLKRPKPGQDMRLDMPAIGPDTFDAIAAAGLSGVVVQAGKTLILDQEKTLSRANELGLFLWVL
ncbi:MAG: UDP-2,3-diacylglucosamine diphosphatase LpxI [Rhodobacteraceae bacterium]|nr:UDP-2,3-diacylglucosamine diphosphatase LpxI [Paracoccaceae bacterium]